MHRNIQWSNIYFRIKRVKYKNDIYFCQLIVIAYPLWFIVIAPISNSNMVNQGKVILWPDAVIIVSTVLILCVYPFVQKYFEKGVMIGAFKG